MSKNPLLENIKNGTTSLGLSANTPEMLELCAHMGFDCLLIDQMFTGLDWNRTEEMIRAGVAAGITPIVRIQSNPWLGYDRQIAVNVTRAQGIGAQFIFISPSCKKEIEECMEVSRDWHRKCMHIHPFNSIDEWSQKIAKMEDDTYIMPFVESEGCLEELDDIMSIPGLKVFLFAMTDASKILANSNEPDWYHTKLWEYLHRAVEIGRKNDVVIGANTSYCYDLDELGRRVCKLHEAGVKLILMQSSYFLFQVAIGRFLNEVKRDLGT